MHTPHHRTGSPPNQPLGALGIAAGLLLGALGSSLPADDPPRERVDPEQLVRQARERLAEYDTIDTDIVQTVYFGAVKKQATGHYTQGPDQRLRLEFDVKIGRVDGHLLQVCDGEDLWTEYTVGEDVRVTTRRVQEILRVARKGGLTGERLMIAELGLGGLPALLAAIEEATDFGRVKRDPENGLSIVTGRWSEPFRVQFEKNPAMKPYTPDLVELALDERLFPRRIRYLRSRNDDYERLVTLELRNTKLGVPVDPARFRYAPPPGVFPKNVTKDYIRKLGGTVPE